MTTAQEKIDRAKTHVLLAYPWWASLILNLRFVESDRIPTMATDGTSLLYNAQFTLGLSDKEVQGTLLHEAAHCALLHCYRRAWRDPLLWNTAADAVANALLLADGISLPLGCVPPADLSKTAEEVYDEPTKGKRKSKGQPQDVYDSGELSEAGSGNGEPGEPLPTRVSEADWKATLASARGLQPATLSRILDAATKPIKDWKAELAAFMHATCRADSHTWSRPSRRISGMPGWKRSPESTIAICVDTSGSISPQCLNLFFSECRALLALSGMSAYVISCDAAIAQEIAPGQDFPTTLLGGGGTDFRPALKRAEELTVDAVVYFTDGDGDFPSDCTLPVLWALTQHKPVPFGTAIYLEKTQ